jgi:hypothetical protein
MGSVSAVSRPVLTPLATVNAMRLLVFLLALGVLLAGCGGGGTAMEEAPRTEEATPTEEARGSGTTRTAAPAVEGRTLDGERLALADFSGRPVFVNVWSSW